MQLPDDDLPDAPPAPAPEGRPADLEQLIAQHLPSLRAFVRLRTGPEIRAHESCSDLVQSVCRELLQDWPRLSFPNQAAFRGWLFTTALNKVRARARHLQRQRRDVRRLVQGAGADSLVAGFAALGTPSGAAMTSERIERLEAAFDRLSEDHREVLTLARLCGLPLAEVGARMGGRTPAAVTMLLGRALQALAAQLPPDDHD